MSTPLREIAREVCKRFAGTWVNPYDIEAACLRAVEQFAEELKARIGSAVTVSGQAVPVLGPAEIDAALRRLRGSTPDGKESETP